MPGIYTNRTGQRILFLSVAALNLARALQRTVKKNVAARSPTRYFHRQMVYNARQFLPLCNLLWHWQTKPDFLL